MDCLDEWTAALENYTKISVWDTNGVPRTGLERPTRDEILAQEQVLELAQH